MFIKKQKSNLYGINPVESLHIVETHKKKKNHTVYRTLARGRNYYRVGEFLCLRTRITFFCNTAQYNVISKLGGFKLNKARFIDRRLRGFN